MSPLDLFFGAFNMMGVPIIESPLLEPQPKLKLSPGCPVSDEFRKEMDAWLLDMFGMEEPQVYQSPMGLMMGPSMANVIRDSFSAVKVTGL